MGFMCRCVEKAITGVKRSKLFSPEQKRSVVIGILGVKQAASVSWARLILQHLGDWEMLRADVLARGRVYFCWTWALHHAKCFVLAPSVPLQMVRKYLARRRRNAAKRSAR